MPNHRHIVVTAPGEARGYTATSRGGGEFRTPPRDRNVHAQKLINEVRSAQQAAQVLAQQTGHVISGLCLEVLGEPNYELKVDSLDDARLGVQLRSVSEVDGRRHATIYVPSGKLEQFVRKIERYQREDTTPRTPAGTPRPKNEDLVAGISEIRLAVLRSFWTDERDLYPNEQERIWWEVWLHVGPGEDPDRAFEAFVETLAGSELQASQHVIRFPERLVFLAYGSPADWTATFLTILNRLAELRRAKEIPTEFLRLPAREQREFAEELAGRIQAPPADAPVVCILDFGVHAAHPLLRPLLDDADRHVFDAGWERVDRTETHGTEMAGIVAFGDDLPGLLAGTEPVHPVHRLESVRILSSTQPNPRETWGYVTQTAVALAEVAAPRRPRVACLPVTADDAGRDQGTPSSWSAAVDEHAAGQLDQQRRLYVVSAGNVRDIRSNANYAYPESNRTSAPIEDPAQSWNALTVGAFTERVAIRSPDFAGHQPLAQRGGLCPTSRTSCAWNDNAWPLKPDIVMEGGNYVRSPDGRIDACDDLALLTTTMQPTGRPLGCMADTSAATALAARAAARLMAEYPNLWPETIRGLLVHSAEWTPEMLRQAPGESQEDRQRRLRCFGYGVPNLGRARYTVENCVSLVHQGTIQPFRLDENAARTNHFVVHSLPWPTAVLRQLHATDVTIRITLSYFIEPSPSGRGWGTKFRYASHGLRFALRGPTESEQAFRRRVSAQEWEEDAGRPPTADPISWAIGSRLRTRGSIHSDWWSTSAADLAECNQVAVYPVTGWWRERKQLERVESEARYALIITISTPVATADLYTPIAQQVGIEVSIAE